MLVTTAYEFITNVELRSKAKAEFDVTGEEEIYKSPFPDDHKPPFHRLTEDKIDSPDM